MDKQKERITGIMLDLLARNTDMQTIINEATEILGNPMILIDTRFRILYSSTNMDVNIDLWKQTLVERYVSDEIISSMGKSQIISRLQTEENPIEHSIPDGYKALRMPLYYKNRYCGFIGIYDYLKPMGARDGECLQIVSKAVSAMLYVDSSLISSVDNSYENYLYELVRCSSPEQAEMAGRKNSAITLGNKKILVCVNKKGCEDEQRNMPFGRIRDIMNQYLYRHYSVIHENRLIMLFCLDKMSPDLYRNTLASIEKYCAKYDLISGVSFEFFRTDFVPYAYKQAVFACCKGETNQDKRVHVFKDYMLDCVMEQCLKEYSASFYEHPAIRKLIEYDCEFNTGYLDTLREYLQNFGNLKMTAARLDIHYNTMKYRISMVEKIIGSSLKDEQELKMQLYYSIRIHDYAAALLKTGVQ